MKPDRSNYEIWLIDWLDGNLDEIRTEQLMAFLGQNPDLKEEAESLSLTRIRPDNGTANQKSLLKKTPADLGAGQIEYLSVAFLEKDLLPEQISELEESISGNPANRQIFESVLKTRLKPQDYSFRNKKSLLRITPAQRVRSIAVYSLSAAAAAAVLMVIFLSPPRMRESVNEVLALNTTDTFMISSGIPIKIYEDITITQGTQADEQIHQVSAAREEIAELQLPVSVPEESGEIPRLNPDMFISSVPLHSVLQIPAAAAPDLLAVSHIITREPSYYDPERSRIKRFLASTFREKVLKEENFNDAPLKSYEIAGAGIEGLNKLLGWEMALVKTSDEEGELKSLYFSSRVLKINTPVKKNDSSM